MSSKSKEVISCTLALKRKSNAKNVPRKQWNNRWQSAYLYDHSIDPCSKFPVVSPIFLQKAELKIKKIIVSKSESGILASKSPKFESEGNFYLEKLS